MGPSSSPPTPLLAARTKRARFRRMLRGAYLLSFAVPYMLLMVAPYKQSIDGAGAELQLCNDMLRLANESLGRNAKFDCSMPDAALCHKPSDRWGPALTETLRGCGVLRDPTTDICPFAQLHANQVLQQNSLISQAPALAPAVQQLCQAESGCLPCVEPASAPTDRTHASSMQSCTNVGLAVAGPLSVRQRCARCFEPLASWRTAPSPP
eukprot:COSAG01_NODE_29630_length_633_cov_1.140449_1_plen_208_part_10